MMKCGVNNDVIEKQSCDIFIDELRRWHHPKQRPLPWKGIKDPYLIWISEIFLQQTQANRVVEFYLRFTSRFPTVQALSKTNFEKALPYYRGLGYYGRLRRMIETAKIVVKKYRGQFPQTVENLRQLPGIGEYTARAIASFAFGKRVLAPDTNVKRVLARVFGSSLQPFLWFDQHYPKHFNLNQALMDLGATVCLAKNPKCGECPLNKSCRSAFSFQRRDSSTHTYLRKGIPRLIPSRNPLNSLGMTKEGLNGKKTIPRHYQKVVVGVLIQDKRVLVSRRKPDQTLGRCEKCVPKRKGLRSRTWSEGQRSRNLHTNFCGAEHFPSYAGLLEFPGGKVEAGEDIRQAMQREFREELGIEVSVRPPFRKIVQHRKKQVLIFHRCRILIGKPRSLERQEVKWVQQEALQTKEFIPANKGIILELKRSRF